MNNAQSHAQATPRNASGTTQRLACILWPAFLAAGLMEILVFAFVNPSDLHLGQRLLGMAPAGVYSVTFFAFWAATATSSWLTVLLILPFRSDSA